MHVVDAWSVNDPGFHTRRALEHRPERPNGVVVAEQQRLGVVQALRSETGFQMRACLRRPTPHELAPPISDRGFERSGHPLESDLITGGRVDFSQANQLCDENIFMITRPGREPTGETLPG
jgi:hypothetical protein